MTVHRFCQSALQSYRGLASHSCGLSIIKNAAVARWYGSRSLSRLKYFSSHSHLAPPLTVADQQKIAIETMSTPVAYDQFILFGDSITEQASTQERGFGFAPALQEAYVRRLDVISRGFSGYNTAQALKVLPNILPTPAQAKIRFMTIFFGANDACSVEARNGQHVPLPIYKANLTTILTHPAVVAHNPRLILITPPPVEERRLEARVKSLGYDELNRFCTVTEMYANAVREVGKELGVPVLDLWNAFLAEAGWKEGEPLSGAKDAPENEVIKGFLHDGLHFTPAAYRLLFAELMKLVAVTWPDQMPENLPYTFPAWDNAEEWAKEGFEMGRRGVVKHA